MSAEEFTVRRGAVRIAVSRGGAGRPVVVCPGLGSTRAELGELIGLLRRDHEVAAFDPRGHGLSSATDRYGFEEFLGDLEAVIAALAPFSSPPVLVGYSLGADLAVHYAAAHPGAVGGLILVDGANPVPEPFLAEDDLPEFRAMAAEMAADPDSRMLLGAKDILALNLELDGIRRGILDRYREIDRPVRMIMSTAMAGSGDDERTVWRNRNWRAGIDRLVRARPRISAVWLEADHRLVVTHAPEITRIIRDAVS
ncbi:pimeloyl-ACP methyl ester carboxylesterase [Nocardia transvalensis]|uniref:Pimeloyl-ACP methyl ester carboxylesterase n=1 Tax=Nocardia transvalensis TaxID=37333 RepID=A0A7W9PJH9_9NOCA|nr:alpha/beta hydrolase [Nocardia transvalensis]MBB5917270.1 pimeloyl-ACP methyl ester carboxylesterase [Nocardia transvalensis]